MTATQARLEGCQPNQLQTIDSFESLRQRALELEKPSPNPGSMNQRLIPEALCAFWILAQVSFKVTVRLKTSFPDVESGSTQ
jgi:hypothetical protein